MNDSATPFVFATAALNTDAGSVATGAALLVAGAPDDDEGLAPSVQPVRASAATRTAAARRSALARMADGVGDDVRDVLIDQSVGDLAAAPGTAHDAGAA
nr:hypothetical protein GCM10020063_101940 [Dactylosporangium thailandense]